MAQGIGQDGFVLSHYDEINLRTLRLLLIGMLFIITGIVLGIAQQDAACSDYYHDADTKEAEENCVNWAVTSDWTDPKWLIYLLFPCGILCIIFWIRSRNIRKSALVAEASGDYEKAILLVTKLKDHEVIPWLTQKRNASPQYVTSHQNESNSPLPVQSPQVQQQNVMNQPATASSPQQTANPTINVIIQNVQPDTGAKNIHIQDSVVTDSDLL